MSVLKILIAAGGTGGHIYPALAMADAFRKKRPDIQIEFVGTAHGFENKIIPAQGYRLHHLPIGRLNSNVALSERVRTVLTLPLAFLKSWWLLKRARPDFVLGVGGHASGPLLLIAALFGYRNAIWEPNAMPGLTNRWLARFVDDCWVVFDAAKDLIKSKNVHRAGMPVREEIEQLVVSPPRNGGFHILVFGGSQGARGVNNAVCEMIRTDGAWQTDISYVHQTGKADYARMCESYGPELLASGRVTVKEYLNDMGAQYAQADLVICRSGTGTLSELAACGKAAILLPLASASDDHQRKNAEALVAKGAADMLLQPELNAETLKLAIQSLRENPRRLESMRAAVRSFHQPHGAEHLVGEFLQRIESHASR